MRYVIDEDLATDIARIGRRIGLDVISVHEIDREGWTDEEQLAEAAAEGRCIVTGNRGDFEDLTEEFYNSGRPHAGVVIVQGALRSANPAAVAHALRVFDRTSGRFAMEYVCHYLHPAE
jgi:predicted nuclease of predicted toxin-antitoxin system